MDIKVNEKIEYLLLYWSSDGRIEIMASPVFSFPELIARLETRTGLLATT